MDAGQIANMNKHKASALPLATESCPINDDCTGERWQVLDDEQLTRLIAIIAMGQAAQASHILSELLPATPAFTIPELKAEAKIRLTVQDKKQEPRIGYPRWQRDGFMFEAISWIAARQVYGKAAYMKDPHVSATSQGLDGLMLELSSDKKQIDRTTVFEDKCSEDPVSTFKNKVIPAFAIATTTREAPRLSPLRPPCLARLELMTTRQPSLRRLSLIELRDVTVPLLRSRPNSIMPRAGISCSLGMMKSPISSRPSDWAFT